MHDRSSCDTESTQHLPNAFLPSKFSALQPLMLLPVEFIRLSLPPAELLLCGVNYFLGSVGSCDSFALYLMMDIVLRACTCCIQL